MSLKNILSIFIFLTILSCQNRNINKKAIEANNQAMAIMSTDFEKSIQLFDKAIQLDSFYLLPHKNKIKLLIKNQKFPEALGEIDILLGKEESGYSWQFRGILLNLLGDSILAEESYKRSIQSFEADLKTNKTTDNKTTNYNLAISMILSGDTTMGKDLILQTDSLHYPLRSFVLNNLSSSSAIIQKIIEQN